jgi:hypothetical protein
MLISVFLKVPCELFAVSSRQVKQNFPRQDGLSTRNGINEEGKIEKLNRQTDVERGVVELAWYNQTVHPRRYL